MGVRIIRDLEQGYSCMYCSTTMLAFGSIFYEDEEPDEFLEWLEPQDPRSLTDKELSEKIHEWRNLKEKEEKQIAEIPLIPKPNLDFLNIRK